MATGHRLRSWRGDAAPTGCVWPGGDATKGYLRAWPVPTGWVGVETLPATDQPRDPLSNT